MSELKDYQWEFIKNGLNKIDDVHTMASDTKTDVALLKSAVVGGNGSIGIQDQIKDVNIEVETCKNELKKKVDLRTCSKIHQNIAIGKKTASDWVKAIIPWCLTVAAIVISYIK